MVSFIQLENEDGQISIYNGQATDRLITPEIADFIDSIPSEFVNREQRVITLMVYEEIKRLNPTIANFGQPVWPATYSFPSGENEMHINMTPFVTYEGDVVKPVSVLIIEITDTMCHYSILPVIEADSLLRSSDREDLVADDFNSCMQDCLCPSPAMNTSMWEYIRCWAFCRFGGRGVGSNSGSGTGTNGGGSNPYFGPVATGGVIPISGFINQGFGNGNTDGTGNGTGAGNPTNNNLANYNFEQTTFSLFDAYYECLADNPEVSTAVWNKLHTPQGTMHCLVPFLNEALSMLCMEAQGVSITAAQLEEEYVRALVYFYGIARTLEDYNFSFCEELGDVINIALLLDLTEMQFEYLLENPNLIIPFHTYLGGHHDLEAAIRNLQNLVAEFLLSNSPPTNPPISISDPICSDIFTFKTFPNEAAPNREVAAMVLRNSYFQFDVPGSSSPAVVHFEDLRFEAYSDINGSCLSTASTAAADAINSAMVQVQHFVNNLPSGTSHTSIVTQAKGQLGSIFYFEFKDHMQACNPGYYVDVAIAGAVSYFEDLPIVDCDEEIVNCPD